MPNKINSWDELKQLRARAKEEIEAGQSQTTIAVGTATCGVAAGANEIMAAIQDELKNAGVDNVKVTTTGCFGFCYAEPMVEVRGPGGGFKYGPVDDTLARAIVRKHIVNGEPIEESIIRQEVERA